MLTYEQQLTGLIQQSFKKLNFDEKFARIVLSNRPELCQFQCNAAMPLAKIAKKAPIEIANQIIENLPENDMIKSIEAVMPGFININLSEEFIAKNANSLVDDKRQGVSENEKSKKIIIDYCAPNIAKSMHIGHLRSTIIGESVKRLCLFMGDVALGDNHMGDWGTQMGMVIFAVKENDDTLPYFDENFEGQYPKTAPFEISNLEEWYPAVSARCKEDEAVANECRGITLKLQQGTHKGYRALWQHIVDVSVAALKVDLKDLGTEFDLWHGESHTEELLPDTIARLEKTGLPYKSDGATVIDVTPNKGKEQPPLLLLKSDGAVLYATTDLATIIERVEKYKADEMIYVVDGRQSLHFYQVFDVAERTGLNQGAAMFHAGFGTINGKDGKPFKSREGGVLKLRTFIDMGYDAAISKIKESGSDKGFTEAEMEEIATKVGISAIKFADLMNHRSANYTFDLEKFTQFEGKTGPYLLYTDVRIRSMLSKATAAGIKEGEILPATTKAETNLMLTLDKFKTAIAKSYEDKAPNFICDHAFELTQAYARFYNDCHILNEEDKARQAGWLSLSKVVAQQLELMFHLLGLQVPEKM